MAGYKNGCWELERMVGYRKICGSFRGWMDTEMLLVARVDGWIQEVLLGAREDS